MLTVLFFARLKDQLGTDSFSLSLNEPTNVANLKKRLIAQNSEWQKPLSSANLLCAVNHEIVDETQIIVETDEVAFFPPVTGG